jgi:hypothetical protein
MKSALRSSPTQTGDDSGARYFSGPLALSTDQVIPTARSYRRVAAATQMTLNEPQKVPVPQVSISCRYTAFPPLDRASESGIVSPPPQPEVEVAIVSDPVPVVLSAFTV